MHRILLLLGLLLVSRPLTAEDVVITDTPGQLLIATPQLEAAVNKQGYVTGIRQGSFLDRQTGYHDAGFGLDIVDWIMEPGSDEAYRDQLEPELIYEFGNEWHGKTPKRSIEGPQICTQAKEMQPVVIRGEASPQSGAVPLRTAAPGKNTGSLSTQWIVFPKEAVFHFDGPD